MELIDFLQSALQGSQRSLKRATEGLTRQELNWQPKPDANSIGLIIFHNARSEDTFIQSTIQQKQTLWEAEKWHEKMSLPANQPGGGYVMEQVTAFKSPELQPLLDYADAVRERTVEYVKTLTPAKLDDKVNWGPRGDFTIGALMALIINHSSQHAGEVSYLRGLQRGVNK